MSGRLKLVTEEQLEQIKAWAPEMSNREMQETFFRAYNVNLTTDQLRGLRKRQGLKTTKRYYTTLFTQEQHDFVVANCKGHSNPVLAQMINERWGLGITSRQMQAYRKNHKLEPSGIDTKFKPGHIPPNKGKKCPGVRNDGQYRKGHKPKNWVPIGTERVRPSNGYIWVKVREPNVWRLKHVMVWTEAHNGQKPPRGYKVIFLDRNPQNCNPDNLALLSNAEFARLIQNHLYTEEPLHTKAGILIAKIKTRIGKLARGKKGKEDGKEKAGDQQGDHRERSS